MAYFHALAERTYKEGGYVGGAIFNEDYSVSHFISNDKKDLAALRSSKYLQSNAEGFYKLVRQLLKSGEKYWCVVLLVKWQHYVASL